MSVNSPHPALRPTPCSDIFKSTPSQVPLFLSVHISQVLEFFHRVNYSLGVGLHFPVHDMLRLWPQLVNWMQREEKGWDQEGHPPQVGVPPDFSVKRLLFFLSFFLSFFFFFFLSHFLSLSFLCFLSWLKTTEIYHLRSGDPKSKIQVLVDLAPSGASEGTSVPSFSLSFWWPPAIFCKPCLIDSLLQSLLLLFS